MAAVRRILAGLVVAAALVPGGATASHQGCFVYGEVMGLDVIRTCSYTAVTETQMVRVGTPNEWRVWVERPGGNGQPIDVTLIEGHGPPAALPVFEAVPGEEVYVSMYAGCDLAVLCGTMGLLEAGTLEGHP